MSDIRLFVFNNGMQLVGDLVSKDETIGKILVKKPVQLVMVPKEPGQLQKSKNEVSMGFAPFMQYTDEWEVGIPFSAADLLTVLTPMRDLINNYNSNFGSGIVIPTL